MPKTKRIDRKMKELFVKNLLETGNNRTEAYLRTMPTAHSRGYANRVGHQLFQDPEVQEIFHAQGISMEYLAVKNKELMESKNESVKASVVRQWNRAVIPVRTATQEVKKLNINLFGDLTDAQVERIRQGNKVTGENQGVIENKPE
jgi:hypothetical protein